MRKKNKMKGQSAESELLTPRAAAEYLHLHEETVRRLAREGKIPAFKVGGTWRFKRSALIGWAESRESIRAHDTILIVDDEPFIRSFVRDTLEPEGYRVLEAGSGAEALQLIERELPSVVLLDLVLPDMGGAAVLKEIRHRYGDIPVVVITGYPDSEIMHQCLQHGPLMMLAKPVGPTKLIEAIAIVKGRKK